VREWLTGTGVVIYYRKEGRALGEVTKYLVYNMRKRQEGGDQAKEYFNCTQHVAGVTDSRFQVYCGNVKKSCSSSLRAPFALNTPCQPPLLSRSLPRPSCRTRCTGSGSPRSTSWCP
jgi:hypothetical protein